MPLCSPQDEDSGAEEGGVEGGAAKAAAAGAQAARLTKLEAGGGGS